MVAARLNLPKSTIYEMARQKRIDGVVRAGRRILFDLDKVDAWIDEGGQALAGGWRHEAEQ